MFCKDEQYDDANTPSPINSNKSLLTPCRRLGLKRKSPASSNQKPNKKQLTAINQEGICEIDNSCDLSTTSSASKFNTPKRKNVFNPPVSSNNFSTPSGEPTHSILSSPEINNSSIVNESKQFENIVINSTCDNMYSLKKRIAEKERLLHCLQRDVVYRNKHDITKLSETTLKWKTGCQDALHELLVESIKRGFELNMAQLLTQLNIPSELVGYNTNLDEFE